MSEKDILATIDKYASTNTAVRSFQSYLKRTKRFNRNAYKGLIAILVDKKFKTEEELLAYIHS